MISLPPALSPSKPPSSSRLSPALILALIVILAAFLRLFHLGYKSLGADEGIAWWMALGQIKYDAPAVYQWAYVWAIDFLGWTEFAGRIPSALYGCLSILIFYAIGKTCCDSRFGLFAAFLAAISAYLVPLSQELRIYSLLGLEILLLFWIFLQLLKGPKAHFGWWLSLLIVGLAGQYTHCFFLFAMGYLGVVLLWIKKPGKWPDILKFLAIMVAVILLSLPELLKTFSVATHRQHVYAADIYHLKMNLWRLLRSYFCFMFGDHFTNRPASIFPYLKTHPLQIGVAVLMAGTWITAASLASKQIFHMARKNDFQALVMRMLMGMLAAFSLLFLIVDVSTSGHLIFIYIPFILLVAPFWTHRRSKIKSAVLIFLLLLTGISLLSYYRLPYSAYERADWRSAAKILQKGFREDDALLILQARNAYYTLKFYYPELEGNICYPPRHDLAALKNQALLAWWDKKSPQEKVDSLLMNHTRLWILESNLKWQPEILAPFQSCWTRDLGYDLQLHRIERRDVQPEDEITH